MTMDDSVTWTDFFQDPEAVEFMSTFLMASPEETAKHWIARQISRYKENRFGLQALIDKRTNEFVGQCGLLKQEVDGQNELEVGYHIFKKYWGQGFAPEAAKVFIAYAFENNLSDSVISIIDIRNTRSQIVAVKNGLIREKQTRWSDIDVFIYRIRKNEFIQTHLPA
jgi:ribosomal-protein-alanine N-acetyltransferase